MSFASPTEEPFGAGKARRLFALVSFALGLCPGQSNAQQPAFDKERYYNAVDYCRRSEWPRPMALSPDKKILCFDGAVTKNMDLSPANDLEQDGLFVVRCPGGYLKSAIELSDLVRDRHAIVVVYDVCFSACAETFLIASYQTFVLKNALVAWHYFQSGDPFQPFCTSSIDPRDGGPRKLDRGPCNATGDGLAYRGPHPAVAQFLKGRAFDPSLAAPPDSKYVRKIVSSIFAETSVYRDIAWTIHPRFYPHLFKTRIDYEAYPESQSEVDDMVARLHWNIRIIYDP